MDKVWCYPTGCRLDQEYYYYSEVLVFYIIYISGGAIEATLTSNSLFHGKKNNYTLSLSWDDRYHAFAGFVGEHKAATQYLMGCASLFGNTICMVLENDNDQHACAVVALIRA